MQFRHLLEQPFGHGHRVGAGALGKGHGHRGVELAPLDPGLLSGRGAEGDAAEGHRLFRAVDHLGHVLQVHRLPLVQAHQQVRHFRGALKKRPGLHQVLPVLAGEMPGGQIDVAHLQGLDQGRQVQAVARQAHRVGDHPHLALAARHHVGAGRVRDALQAVQQLVRHPAQFVVVGAVAVQGQGDDGHVVDVHGLDHPARHALGHLVDIGEDLVVDLEEAGLQVFPHLELGGDHREGVPGLGIEVLQALHLPQLLFQVDDHQVFHFLGRGPREADEDVHHGHLDLGVFFPGGVEEGHDPGQQAHQDDDGGQLGQQKELDQAGGEAEMDFGGFRRFGHV